MNQIDVLIEGLFKCWVGPANGNLDVAKAQLFKNLNDQLAGYWSGSTAYGIMTYGGFLLDGKSGEKKKLTALGEMFMAEMRQLQVAPKP